MLKIRLEAEQREQRENTDTHYQSEKLYFRRNKSTVQLYTPGVFTLRRHSYPSNLPVNMTKIKTPDCTVCNRKFDKIEYLNNHMQKAHNEPDHKRIERLTEAEEAKIVCELCDKIFPNRVQKSNHKLLVHTVRDEILKCDYQCR